MFALKMQIINQPRGNSMTKEVQNTDLRKIPTMTPEEVHDLLETRYGPGFAQWFVDQMQKKRAA
jgi:hypothetical protein